MRRITIQRVLLVTLFVLLFVVAARVPVDTDTWWHLRSGEHTLNEGIIYTDPFSHTMQGEPWTNHSWGAQVIMHGFYALLGNTGLALYTALLAVGGVAFLYPICMGNAYLRAFVLILTAVTASVFWSARPQMASFFFSAVVLYLLYRHKRDGVDRLWFLPPVFLLWGNLHAGYSIGFIFLLGFFGGEVLGNLFARDAPDRVGWRGLRKLLLVTVVSVAALVVNPYGLEMLTVPFDTVGIGALRQYIQEWQSPDFQGTETWPFIAMVVLLLGTVGASSRRLDWTDFALASGTLFMALLYARNVAVFAVAATPALALHAYVLLHDLGWTFTPKTRVTQAQGRLNVALIGVIVLAALVYVADTLSPQTVDKYQRQILPLGAADYIQANGPPGPMFNSYNWGGYLLWRLPDYPVYIDGRTDLYGSEFIQRWLDTTRGLGKWEAVLREDRINLVVVEDGIGLAQALDESPDWTQAYPAAEAHNSDDEENGDEPIAVIYQRDEPLSASDSNGGESE